MEMLIYLVFAMLAALVLIVLAKVVMQFLIRKPADYYLKEEAAQDDLIMAKIRDAQKKGN